MGYQWEDYSSIDLKANDYLANVRAMALYSTQKNLAELKKPVDKNKWGMPAHMVNAYYHQRKQELRQEVCQWVLWLVRELLHQ